MTGTTLSLDEAYGKRPEQEPKRISLEDAYRPPADDLRSSLRANAFVSSGRDPALVAESERLARKYGLPVDTAERQIDSLRQHEQLTQVDNFATQAPRTAEWMASDPNATAIARDDYGVLSALESAFDVTIRAPVSGVVSGVGSGVSGIGESLNMAGRNAQRFADFSAQTGEQFWRLFSDDLADKYAANVQAQRDFLPDWAENPLNLIGGGIRSVGSAIESFGTETIGVPLERQNLATDIGSGIGSLIPYLAATLYTGGTGAVVLGGAQGIDVQADRAESAGTYGTASSDLAQTIAAPITAVTERYGIERLLRRLPPGVRQSLNRRVADILVAGVGEGAQEVTESVLQDTVTRVLVDETFSPFQGIEREGFVGFAVGALFRGGIHVMRQQYDSELATQESEALSNIEALIGRTKLAELSPERMRDLLGKLKNSSISDVYLPADRFRALFQSDQEMSDAIPALGVDRGEYAGALLSNGQVRVPVEGYFTALTPEQRAAAKPHARLTHGGMTPEEALSFSPETALREFLDATGAEVRDATDPTLWIQDQVRAQAVAAGAGPAYAEMTAAIYGAAARTMSQRFGLSVEQLFGTPEDSRLDIMREIPQAMRRVIEARNADAVLDASIEALRSGRLFTDREVQGQRFLELLRSKGGIDPSAFGAGDLRAQDAHRYGVLRRGGMTLEDAVTLALDNGYLNPTAKEMQGLYDADGVDVNAVLALISDDLGNIPAYSPEGFNVDRARFNDATNELGRMLDELGISQEQLASMDNAAVRKALGMDGMAGDGPSFDQAAPVGTEAFREWFQQSKVANADGSPLVVYHGTGEEFAAFDRLRLGQSTGHASSGLGFFFTPNRAGAEAYADNAANGVPADATVLDVYLSIQNPYTMTLDEAQSIEDVAEAAAMRMSLQAQGFDGVWIPEQNAWVAFEPTQVKSIHNRGTWSRTDPRMLFQSVFHGSPHRGIEQTGFSLQKIGTGEGAQAYGWGLYFAGKREIAEYYRTTLTERSPAKLDGVPIEQLTIAERSAIRLIQESNGSAEAALRAAKVDMQRAGPDGADFHVERYNTIRDIARGKRTLEAAKGQLYAAEIPDDGDLLDWDAPLSEQPEKIKAAIGALGFGVEKNPDPFRRDESWLLMFNGNSIDAFPTKKAATAALNALTGQQLYQKLATSRGQRGTSEFLFSLGIPGLRYLDGTSRGAGDGSRNYVIWDEGAISDVRTFYQSASVKSPEDYPYHRYTKSSSPDTGAGYMMFAENQRKVENAYGENHHTFDPADLPADAVVDARDQNFHNLVVNAFEKRQDEIESFGASPEQLASELDPNDIVNSAGLWDSPELVQIIWDEVLEPNGWLAVTTSDGAIVFDSGAVKTWGEDSRTFYQSAGQDDYRGEHRAPTRDSGAPGHDVTGGGNYYPDDVYGPNAVQYYGSGYDALDREAFSIVRSLKGRPDAKVKIYRAVPKVKTKAELLAEADERKRQIMRRGSSDPQEYERISAEIERLQAMPDDPPASKVNINPGDWVTITRGYAKDHGESLHGKGNYTILSKTVKASEIFTNGDSIQEWGYDDGTAGERTFYQSDQQRTPEFREWFGGSQVVDENGEPLQVYHGTTSDFDTFSSRFQGSVTRATSSKSGFFFTSSSRTAQSYADHGALVTPIEKLIDEAEKAASRNNWDKYDEKIAQAEELQAELNDPNNRGRGQNILPVYLSIKNPLVIDANGETPQGIGGIDPLIQKAKRAGHDGVIIRNFDDAAGIANDRADHFIVFNSNQIKSVFNERPTSDPNILKQSRQGRGPRGEMRFTGRTGEGLQRFLITLRSGADKSTLMHEGAHFFLEMYRDGDAYLRGLPADSLTPVQAQQMKDNAKLLEWLGVDSFDQLALLAGESPEIKAHNARATEAHEKFAETFEVYMREGKAPSMSLRRAFQQFRQWLVNIYKSLSDPRIRRANLTPEVVEFFDRMLATDQEIEAVRSDLGLKPLITPEMRGNMTDEDYDRYLMAVEQSRQAAIDSETAVQFSYLRRAAERDKSADLRRLEAEVLADMNDDKVWRAISMLRTGKLPDGSDLPDGETAFKLDTQAVTDMMGKEWVKKNLALMHRKEGGVHPDLAASVLGFASGNEMLQQFAMRPSKQDAVKAEALRRWDDMNPDPLLDGSLDARAVKAAHNDAQARVFVAEINALSPRNRVVLEPLKQYVERVVSGMQVKSLNPNRHRQTEMREGRRAITAAAKGNREEALQARRAQLMAHLMFRAETAAKERAEAFRERGIKLAKKPAQERLARAGWEAYLDKVNQILAAFDLRRMTNKDIERKKSLRAWVEAQQEAGEITAVSEELIARVEAERVTNWRESKVSEIDEASDALDNIEHLASLKNKLTAGQQEREWEDARVELLDRLQQSMPSIIMGEASDRDVGDLEAARRSLRGALENLNRPENIIEALDGGTTGPWHDLFWNPLQAAEDKAAGYRRQFGGQLKALRKEHPEVFKTFQKNVTILGGKLTISRATLIGIALNAGNASNLQRLMDGGIAYGTQRVRIGQLEVNQILSELRSDELAFVQGMWDTVNSLWPDIVSLQRKMSGLPPEKVEGRAFVTASKDGKTVSMRGGYWPLVYDPKRSKEGETQEQGDVMRTVMGSFFTRAFTPKGYQKTRAEVFESPLQLDFAQVMSRHMDHVITDLSHREVVRDVNRIMTDASIKENIILRAGREAYDNLQGSLSYAVSASSAVAVLTAKKWHPFIDAVLTNTSVAALAIRPDISLGNLASATIQGLDRVGVKALMRGWWALETNRAKTTEAIVQKSGFMAARLGETDYLFSQEIGALAGRRGWGPAYRRMMMSLHRLADFEVTRALWWGAYQQALDGKATESQAIEQADKAIRQTQTATGRKDVSTFERDASFKQARQFMGPMFVIFGRLYAAARGEGATQRVGARAVTLMVQVFLAPAIFALAAGRWPEDGDDDDEIGQGDWARWLAVNVGLFPVMTIPYIRDLSAGAEAYFTDGQATPRAAPTTQAVISMIRASQSMAQNLDAYGETGEIDYLDATRDITGILGPVVGAPASQVRITTKTIEAVLDDPERDKTELARMAVYGPPRE